MKTLYIQINASPLPEEREDIILLDCDKTNSFCSFFGYELVDGLRMPDNTPCYKVFQAGKLLTDFKSVNEWVYRSILYQWERIFCELLQGDKRQETYSFSIPSEYTDWLSHHEDFVYRKVGERLSAEKEIRLSTEELYDEIALPVRTKLKSYIKEGKESFDRLVFSDESVKSSSAIVREIREIAEKIEFVRLYQWQEEEERKRKEEEIRCSDQEFTVNGVSFTMVYVKAGSFYMGSNDGCSNEKPVHLVTLSKDYYMGQFQVTQKLWRAVMGGDCPSSFKSDNLPVECVSWDDCQVFVRRLSELTGGDFRLPTEAQWEYAARGGVRSKGYTYAGSDDWDKVGWYSDKTHEVGTKQPNELGLYDMSGNVWEFCNDWYASSYPFSSETTDPKGPGSGSSRVRRGGSFCHGTSYSRVACRAGTSPGVRDSSVGFRLVLFS